MRTRPSPFLSPRRTLQPSLPVFRAGAVPGWLLAALLLSGAGWAQVTERVSVGSGVTQSNGDTSDVGITPTGRFVVFDSDATNLVVGDANGVRDVFVYDRVFGITELVSVDSNGAQGDGASLYPRISSDGRRVAFWSFASNLVVGDTNARWDVFVRDRDNGITQRVSIATSGAQGEGDLGYFGLSISAGGRFVAFTSQAGDLVNGDTNSTADVFVRDQVLNVTDRASVFSNGSQGFGWSDDPSIAANGRWVAFQSLTSFDGPDANMAEDVFVHDRLWGTTTLISKAPLGSLSDGASYFPSISADGKFVTFASTATNLVSGDTNQAADVFLRARRGGPTERVSVSSTGAEGDQFSIPTSISDDGRYVGFSSEASNLVLADTNAVADVFLRDCQLGVTERLSVDSTGQQADNATYDVSISSDGRYAALSSYAANLVAGDTNSLVDAFVRDRVGGGSFTSLCHPGYGGVIWCHCANPPNGSGPGCNNHSNTGGAILSGAGWTGLSGDTLTFTTSGEVPGALSVVLQGTAVLSGGLWWGQGVGCVGGWTHVLYTKTATGGSITAPDFGAGDLPVSVRSAALGDTIQPGQSRWYLVYYRDTVSVCGSTINETQTGEVVWSP
jgi:Tol biopolymer transport system component